MSKRSTFLLTYVVIPFLFVCWSSIAMAELQYFDVIESMGIPKPTQENIQKITEKLLEIEDIVNSESSLEFKPNDDGRRYFVLLKSRPAGIGTPEKRLGISNPLNGIGFDIIDLETFLSEKTTSTDIVEYMIEKGKVLEN